MANNAIDDNRVINVDDDTNNNHNNFIDNNNYYHYQDDDDHSDEIYDDNNVDNDDEEYNEDNDVKINKHVVFSMQKEFLNFVETLRCFEDGKFIDIKADKELQERLGKLLHSKQLASKFVEMQLLVRLVIIHLMYYDRYILVDNVNKSKYCTPSTILCHNFACKPRCGFACSLTTIGKVNKFHDHNCKQLSQSDMEEYIQNYIAKYNLLDRTLLPSSSTTTPSSSSRPYKRRRKFIPDSNIKDDQSVTIGEMNDDKTAIVNETISSTYTSSSSNTSLDLVAYTTNPETIFRQLEDKIKLSERSISRVS